MEFPPLNKFEKERKVIELHTKEGKTLKEISKIVKMSFRDISRIIKEYERKKRLETKKGEENSQKTTKKPSLSSQAFILYREGKKPIDVAIELDIPFKKANKFWFQFLNLERMDECYEFYQTYRYDIPTLLSIANFMKRNNVFGKDISTVLMEAKTIANLQSRHSILKHDIEKLENSKNNYLLNQNTNYQLTPLGPLPRYYNW